MVYHVVDIVVQLIPYIQINRSTYHIEGKFDFDLR